MDYKNFTDEELIEKLRAGDKEITDYIIRKYIPLIRKKTNARYLIGGEPEDLIQEGMVGLFNAIRDYNPEKEVSFFAFADLCITRKLNSTLEASNRMKHMPLNTYISFSNQEEENGLDLEQIITEQTISPEQLMIEQEALQEFIDKLEEKLSPMERKVLYLHLEGINYIQIAEQMGKNAKSIDNALQRIRGKAKLLKEDM